MPDPFARIRSRVVSGIAVLIPLFVTILALRALFGFTVGSLLPLLDPAVDHWPEVAQVGLGLGVFVLLVYALGELATHVVGRKIIGIGEKLLLNVPVVRVIYSASQQVVSAFQRQDKAAFKSVVLVEFPRPGMRAVGFLTSTVMKEDGSVWKTVFIPTTPNPTTGFLQILPASAVTSTDLTVEEAFQMVMSLGVLGPKGLSRLL